MILAIIASLILWPLAGLLTLLGKLVGIPLTGVAILLRRYHYNQSQQWWEFGDRWLRPFQTSDNGALPAWWQNQNAERSLRWNMWVWCAWRNGFGGSPLAFRCLPGEVEMRGNIPRSMTPATATIENLKQTGKRKWSWAVYRRGWRMGVWAAVAIGKASKIDHFEIRHGWKLRTDTAWLNTDGSIDAPFTLWDTGRRIS